MSRLILLSGANPNVRTNFLNNAPVLCVAALEGFLDMVTLLLEFNAVVDLTGDDGVSPLCYAAQRGHIEVIRHLVSRRARVSAPMKVLKYTSYGINRIPTAQGKQGKWQKNPCQGKHREFGNFAKTQGKHRESCLLKL